MESFLVHFCIYFAYYIIGAYATTDILRLLSGSTLSISDSGCYCPCCGNKIPLSAQIPIFSYIKNHGKCTFCKTSIPISDLFPEIFLFLSLSTVTAVLDYQWIAYFLCIAIYEMTKFLFLIRCGKREQYFYKNLILSLLHNLVIFLLLAVLFGLEHLA